jgi:type III restriction enzyme
MLLKNYQRLTLQSLEFFCDEYSKTGLISQSFQKTRKEFELATIPYADYENLNVPSVCFRIPTGGGKTLLAAYSIPLIIKKLFNTESSLVFWLAPSEPIVEQTKKALKDPRHPYRQFLDQSFKERTVNVMSISEAHSRAFDLSTELPIIVATIQTFSTENEEGRNFYKENGTYQEFFTGTDITPSLSNAIKQANPIVIMDEAHNAKTDLRVSKLIELNPSFMLELTATPQLIHRESEGKYASNILYSVSASQLKAEDMIKLPIVLETINKWEYAIEESIKKRVELEVLATLEAQESGQYIRPIVLFKAEANRGNNPITHDKILEVLMKDYGIPREEIAVHTGSFEDLKNVDLMDKDCNIKYVITVDKLKEGWDAPFAYILSAIGDMKSSTAVEQILGRILRLPYAKRKSQSDLEKSYAFIASSETAEVIKNLKDSLIQNGFERLEAEIHISSSRNSNKSFDGVLSGLFAEHATKLETLNIEIIPDKFKQYINHNKDSKEFSIVKPIPKKDREEFVAVIKRAVSDEKDIVAFENMINIETSLTNFKSLFSVPKLLANTQQGLFDFDKSILLQEISWSDQEIAKYAKLSESEFSIIIEKEMNIIDISSNDKIKIQKLNAVKENLFSLNGESIKLSDTDIVKLVLNHINSSDLQTLKIRQLAKYIHLIVIDLLDNRKFSTIDLKANLHILTETIHTKIKKLEESVIKKHYEALFEDPKYFEVDPTKVFVFDPDNYPASSPIADTGMFTKHYYKLIDKMNGEETKFASYIDSLEEVEFWVRNIERNAQYSFWLQTATDKFYPDFIVRLKSGKILVIEYKGEDRRTNDDTKEKTALGKAWANLTPNAGFAMVFEDDYKVKMANLLS